MAYRLIKKSYKLSDPLYIIQESYQQIAVNMGSYLNAQHSSYLNQKEPIMWSDHVSFLNLKEAETALENLKDQENPVIEIIKE